MTRLLSILIVLGCSLEAMACNIPVFRYALERWRTDACELVVFYDELTTEQEQFLKRLEAASNTDGGTANANVMRSKVGVDPNESNRSLWKSISEREKIKLPYLVVRSGSGQGRVSLPWQGTLDEARMANLLESPARTELIRRLQTGHSIVWLVLPSSDTKRTSDVSELIQTELSKLESKVKLPDGIGLPGSELHSEVPLLVKFSSLTLDRNDPKEAFMVKLLNGMHPEAAANNEPLVVPVFGRGRALEVIPAISVDASLVEDLTIFLMGACSCQVKERNPGFDLLMATDWDTELFGEGGLRPPPSKTVADRNRTPVLLGIPPGGKK